jgi:hypothetical protein
MNLSHLLQVTLSGSPEYPLSQVANYPVGFPPVDRIPVGLSLGYVCIAGAFALALHLTFPFDW